MIYISSPPENLDPKIARERISAIKTRLFEMGALVIDPTKLGFPDTWLQKEKDDKRAEIIQEKATAIFLQADWNTSTTAVKEFQAVTSFNSNRKNRPIHIYFEDFGGFHDVESDLRDGILIPEIPAA